MPAGGESSSGVHERRIIMNIQTEIFNGPCSCGREHKIEVKDIILGNHAAEALLEALKRGSLSQYQNPLILCDENTREAAMGKLETVWQLCGEIVLPPQDLHANNHGVDMVHNAMEDMESGKESAPDLLLAVGAGTIHDLTRYVAHEKGIPFVSVPTAASVDGFVSTVAAMTWNGMKKTLPAVAPIYVFADTEIFSRAPYRLTASGISDLMGKYIALADWRIAHEVTGEYICERICGMEMDALETVCKCLDGLRTGAAEAYENLMYALLLSGLAMQMIGNSRPASCAEHHVSHLWEMEIINDYVDALHGEKVSIGLVLTLNLYKKIANSIQEGTCHVKPYEGLENELIRKTFGAKGLYEATIQENTPDPMLAVDSGQLEKCLPKIAQVIDALPEVDEILSLLKKGGCVYNVGQIGLTEDIIPLTIQLSPYVRNRLSFNRIRKMLVYPFDGTGIM